MAVVLFRNYFGPAYLNIKLMIIRSVRGLFCNGFVEASDFEFHKPKIFVFVILISGINCNGFVPPSDFDSQERMILLFVILISGLHCTGKPV